jgi:hypothetical protein
MNLENMTTNELAEKLPNNLHLARNENAPEHDRWRVWNSHTEKYCEPGAATVRDLLIATLERLDKQYRAWTGSSSL